MRTGVEAWRWPEEQSDAARQVHRNREKRCGSLLLVGKLRERRNFNNTLPGMSRVSLRTAMVASRPMVKNSAKKITATIRTGMTHPGAIVRRQHRGFGDRRHLAW